MDYKEYMTAPEGLEYERADAEQQRVLQMINERDKAARIFAMGMVILLGIVAAVSLYLFAGLIAGIAAFAFAVVLFVLVSWYLAKVFPQKGVHYALIRATNHIHKDAKGFFVRAISDKQKDYIFVTEHEYKIMKMNVDNRR